MAGGGGGACLSPPPNVDGPATVGGSPIDGGTIGGSIANVDGPAPTAGARPTGRVCPRFFLRVW